MAEPVFHNLSSTVEPPGCRTSWEIGGGGGRVDSRLDVVGTSFLPKVLKYSQTQADVFPLRVDFR